MHGEGGLPPLNSGHADSLYNSFAGKSGFLYSGYVDNKGMPKDNEMNGFSWILGDTQNQDNLMVAVQTIEFTL